MAKPTLIYSPEDNVYYYDLRECLRQYPQITVVKIYQKGDELKSGWIPIVIDKLGRIVRGLRFANFSNPLLVSSARIKRLRREMAAKKPSTAPIKTEMETDG